MNEKREAITAAAEKFQRLDESAQYFVLGYMACYEALHSTRQQDEKKPA